MTTEEIVNKTKYFRLHLYSERSEADLWENKKDEDLVLRQTYAGQTDRVTPWALDGAKKWELNNVSCIRFSWSGMPLTSTIGRIPMEENNAMAMGVSTRWASASSTSHSRSCTVCKGSRQSWCSSTRSQSPGKVFRPGFQDSWRVNCEALKWPFLKRRKFKDQKRGKIVKFVPLKRIFGPHFCE